MDRNSIYLLNMKLNDFICGMAIIGKYYNDDGWHIGADYDIIYLYPTDKEMNRGDIQKLLDIGWYQPDSIKDEYNLSNNWAANV